MTHAEIVHKYQLADQYGYAKKLMVLGVIDKFFVKAMGRPCGDDNIFETDNVDELLKFVESYGNKD